METAELFYTDTGRGRNVMLIHGWTCDSHDWIFQIPALEDKFRVVAVDLRGHGRSEVMSSGSYAPADYDADIENLIETRFPGEKFVVVGHSMGAQIAARLSIRRPDLVEAVIAVDGTLGFSDELSGLFEQTAKDLNEKEPGEVGPGLFTLFYGPKTPEPFKRWHARRLQGTPAHVVRESFAPLMLGADQIGVGEQSEAFIRSIQAPYYHLCRFDDQAGCMQPWLSHPKSKVDVWADSGHWIHQDRAEDVNAAIIEWIEQLDGTDDDPA